MGSINKKDTCGTCGESQQDCVGHFGVVNLELPVFHIGYFKLVLSILQNICKGCANVLLDEQQRRKYLKRLRGNVDGMSRKDILKGLNAACKKVTICPHCSSINGTVKRVGALKIIHEKFKRKAETDEELQFKQSFNTAMQLDPYIKSFIHRAQEDLNPLTVKRLFERISAQDCELMGLCSIVSSPADFIWSSFAIPPNCLRPSVGQENSSVEDDITILASEIIDINNKIKACIGDGSQISIMMEYWDFLQLQCAMYITSELPGIPNHLQGVCINLL